VVTPLRERQRARKGWAADGPSQTNPLDPMLFFILPRSSRIGAPAGDCRSSFFLFLFLIFLKSREILDFQRKPSSLPESRGWADGWLEGWRLSSDWRCKPCCVRRAGKAGVELSLAAQTRRAVMLRDCETRILGGRPRLRAAHSAAGGATSRILAATRWLAGIEGTEAGGGLSVEFSRG